MTDEGRSPSTAARAASGESGLFRGRDGDFSFVRWGGRGPLAVLAHASGLTAGTYGPLAARLTARLRPVGLDARGHGGTLAPADPRRLRDWDVFRDDLARFLDHLGEPALLVGHSMGGMVGLAVAIRRPDLVRGLVLVEPGIVPPAWRAWVFAAQRTGLWRHAPIVARAARKRRDWPSREALRAALRSAGIFRRWSDEFFEAYVETGTEALPDGTVRLRCDPAWEARCIATPPVGAWRWVPAIRVPTLLLYGEISRTFLPPMAARFRRALPHARVERFAGAGHYLPMERPDGAARAIQSFLDQEVIR